MNPQNSSDDENAYAAPTSSPVTAKKKRSFTLVELAVVLAIIFLLVGMVMPMVGRGGSREPVRRTQCLNKVREIAIATLNYESANGHFPPAYIADENGKPMHSWRVLLLPYLEHKALYDSYRMDEAWDGPNNSELHDEIVSVYRCPSSSSDENCTDFVLITGEGTAFEDDQTISWVNITDGSSNTVMVTEIAASDIHWMKPQDISLGQFLGLEKSAAEPNHSSTKNVALFDGSTHSIEIDANAEELKKLVLIADGEVVNVLEL